MRSSVAADAHLFYPSHDHVFMVTKKARGKTTPRKRKPFQWPRDLASVPTLVVLNIPRAVPCRACKKDLPAGQRHFGVEYRGRYGHATSHLCTDCATRYVREVYNEQRLARVRAGLQAVHHAADKKPAPSRESPGR